MDKLRANAIKYKILRKKQDVYYESRLLKTFFNSYIKRGQRGTASRSLASAMCKFRQQTSHSKAFDWTFSDLLLQVRRPIVLVRRRVGAQYTYVPDIATTGFKRDELGVNALYKSTRRVEGHRLLEDRVATALVDIFDKPGRALIHRDISLYKEDVLMQQVNYEVNLSDVGKEELALLKPATIATTTRASLFVRTRVAKNKVKKETSRFL